MVILNNTENCLIKTYENVSEGCQRKEILKIWKISIWHLFYGKITVKFSCISRNWHKMSKNGLFFLKQNSENTECSLMYPNNFSSLKGSWSKLYQKSNHIWPRLNFRGLKTQPIQNNIFFIVRVQRCILLPRI